jgi:hypothetical protein
VRVWTGLGWTAAISFVSWRAALWHYKFLLKSDSNQHTVHTGLLSVSVSVVIVDFRTFGLNLRLLEILSHSLNIASEPEQSTQFITPTKFTLLINN